MNKHKLKEYILIEIMNYKTPVPTEPTVGIPWDDERVTKELSEMKECLVEPYKNTFVIAKTNKSYSDAEGYVVAEDNGFKMFFEPSEDIFYLASKTKDGKWITFGIEGNPVDVFLSR